MSNANPITASCLTSAESVLSQALFSCKPLLDYYSGSKYEQPILTVMDLTQTAITLVQDARLSRRTPKHRIAAITAIAIKFASLSPHQKRLAIEVITALVRDKVR